MRHGERKNMIKLIASDIDGTLVREGTTKINREVFEVLHRLREKGVQFAAASGRHRTSLENLFAPLEKRIFYISDNGASIGMENRHLFSYKLEKEICRELILAMRENPNFLIIAACRDSYYTDYPDKRIIGWVREGYKAEIRLIEDLLGLEEEILKISAYSRLPVYEQGAYLIDRFRGRLSVKYAGEMWLDCMNDGVNKGAAIKLLQDALGIGPEETMVFGDQWNDIEMFQSAYYSYAMANAVEEAKKAARFEADSVENDGVLKILKLLL